MQVLIPQVWEEPEVLCFLWAAGKAEAAGVTDHTGSSVGQILALSHFSLPAYMSYYHILFFILMNCKQVFFSKGYCAGACW